MGLIKQGWYCTNTAKTSSESELKISTSYWTNLGPLYEKLAACYQLRNNFIHYVLKLRFNQDGSGKKLLFRKKNVLKCNVYWICHQFTFIYTFFPNYFITNWTNFTETSIVTLKQLYRCNGPFYFCWFTDHVIQFSLVQE